MIHDHDRLVLAVMGYCISICAYLMCGMLTRAHWQFWVAGFAAVLALLSGVYWSIEMLRRVP